jgi:hypothetical protein
MARDAILGMTQDQALELTGLSRSTFRDLITGNVVGDVQYRKFCSGLSIDAEPFLEAKRKVVPPPDPFTSLGYVLAKEIQLSPESCRMIMRLARERAAVEHRGGEQRAA